MSDEEKAIKWAHQWVIIAFTRAIDTLVITLEDINSDFAQILRKLFDKCKDYVEWID